MKLHVASLRQWLALACGVPLLCAGSVRAQSTSVTKAALTDHDRTEIQQLVSRYQSALSSCASREYAELFIPDGVFASDDFRGAKHRELYGKSATLVGRTKLMELVETEEFCMDPALRAARATRTAGNRAEPQLTLEATADGAKGVIPLGGGGRYEDEYVRTTDGWRFKSRRVFMPPVAEGRGSANPARQQK